MVDIYDCGSALVVGGSNSGESTIECGLVGGTSGETMGRDAAAWPTDRRPRRRKPLRGRRAKKARMDNTAAWGMREMEGGRHQMVLL